MKARPLAVEWIPGEFTVCRLAPSEPVPTWASSSTGLSAVVRTRDELSVVAETTRVPAGVTAEHGWVALRVAGTLEFSLVGVLSTLTSALAAARVPVLAVSTYDTDVLLIKTGQIDDGIAALAGVADVSALRR